MLKFILQSTFPPEKDLLFLHKRSAGEQTPAVPLMKIASVILLKCWEILKIRILQGGKQYWLSHENCGIYG